MWKTIPGHPTYQASRRGEIRRKGGKILKPWLAHGYEHVSFSEDGVVSKHKVHRLILFTFVGKPPIDKPFACHRDGTRNNNRLENLYWGSVSENSHDSVAHGTHPALNGKHRKKLLTDEQEQEVKGAHEGGVSMNQIAKDYGISIGVVHRAVHGYRRSRTSPCNGVRKDLKLDAAGVTAIRKRLAAGERVRAVATDMGVSVGSVYAIRSGARWGGV